jgi:hypothetical protein
VIGFPVLICCILLATSRKPEAISKRNDRAKTTQHQNRSIQSHLYRVILTRFQSMKNLIIDCQICPKYYFLIQVKKIIFKKRNRS